MLQRIYVAFLALVLLSAPSFAQSVGMPSVGGYWSTTACGTGPSPCFVQYGSTIPVSGSSGSGAADSGNPVKIGGVFTTTAPTVTSGQRTDAAFGATGSLRTQLCNPNDGASTNCTQLGADNADGASSTSAAQRPIMLVRPQVLNNGGTWDREFTCSGQVSATITAGSTTEIVALTASQVIRVCSFTVGMSTTGTAKFVYGTGTNCGSGTTDITPATTITSGNVMALSAANGSVFRTIASNALCVTAATGNAQVFVAYAKY